MGIPSCSPFIAFFFWEILRIERSKVKIGLRKKCKTYPHQNLAASVDILSDEYINMMALFSTSDSL